MFHKAYDLEFKEGTLLEVKFRSGEVKQYDMRSLYAEYPVFRVLENRELFLSGKLQGAYGIVWNDELDIAVDEIFENGITVRIEEVPAGLIAADAVKTARASADMSQKELATLTGIDQSDISKIERGFANPSVHTLNRIAKALGGELVISIIKTEQN